MYISDIIYCFHPPLLQFVEDTGDILFFKDKNGTAATYPVLSGHSKTGSGAVSDSGVELDDETIVTDEVLHRQEGDLASSKAE